jgi:hypothetical protein
MARGWDGNSDEYQLSTDAVVGSRRECVLSKQIRHSFDQFQ